MRKLNWSGVLPNIYAITVVATFMTGAYVIMNTAAKALGIV